MSTTSNHNSFQVSLGIHLLSGFVDRCSGWWTQLGNLESATLRTQLDRISIDRPVYIAGLARAGTTVLLELLSRHPEVATHKYRDFPGLFVPTWWDRGRSKGEAICHECAHGDRLQVTQNSPEAMEECLWMAFFADAHRPEVCNVLDQSTRHTLFERFYSDHIRKLLLVRNRSRYVAKGNYNLTRLAYLQKLHPSSRFIVPVRHPREHIASLIRQHRHFCAGAAKHPRALAYLQRVGHFEFGPDRRAISLGDGVALDVMQLWRQGEEVRGFARYWSSLYGWLADQLSTDVKLRSAIQIVCYENLCANPLGVVDKLIAHCDLTPAIDVHKFASQIESQRYYDPGFTKEDESIIAEETDEVAKRFQASFAENLWRS